MQLCGGNYNFAQSLEQHLKGSRALPLQRKLEIEIPGKIKPLMTGFSCATTRSFIMLSLGK